MVVEKSTMVMPSFSCATTRNLVEAFFEWKILHYYYSFFLMIRSNSNLIHHRRTTILLNSYFRDHLEGILLLLSVNFDSDFSASSMICNSLVVGIYLMNNPVILD